MNYSKIKEILTSKGISLPQLADKIGMSKAGIYLAIDKKRLSIDTLEKIAEVLDVPVTIFFDEYRIDRIEKLNNLLDETKKLAAESNKLAESKDYVTKVTGTLILSMGISYYQYLETLRPPEKESLQKSDFGKKIENLLQIDWDDALKDYTNLTKVIAGKNVL